MQRYGMTLRLRPEHESAYRRFHAAVWPEVLAQITRSNIRNYTIFLREGVLFAYFEYIGDNFQADMRRMGEDAKTREWWAIMEPMQQTYPDRREGEWWSHLEEVFHHD